MKLPVAWLPEANAELQEARAWYDNIRPELSERFARAVEATIEVIAENPLQFPIVYRNLRRAGVRRFPYSIFFDPQNQQITVIACFHGKQNPIRWQARQER
jgi:plasmid stabilization system protein ParE